MTQGLRAGKPYRFAESQVALFGGERRVGGFDRRLDEALGGLAQEYGRLARGRADDGAARRIRGAGADPARGYTPKPGR